MADPTCTIDDCDRKTYARGWCEMHYARWRRNGHTGPRPPATSWERFWPKVDVHLGVCWFWTAATTADGYGHFQHEGRVTVAHRVAWELLVGPIPEGLTLDHLCRQRNCVNPDHLEPVPLKVNCQRGVARTQNVTHCPAGHPYDRENTRRARGQRVCRTCERDRMRRKRAAA